MSAAILDAIAPATGAVGESVMLTATGTGFADGDVIAYGIEDLATTFVDATTLTAMVTPIDPGQHAVLVHCADGDTNALGFEALAAPPIDTDPAALLEQLKTGDISGLETADDNALLMVRTAYSDWAKDERDRLKAEYQAVYDAIVAEIRKRDIDSD
jgi:hypothetical protein